MLHIISQYRSVVAGFLLVSAASCASLEPVGATDSALTAEVEAAQPNILWIITDDQRPDSIQAYNRAVFGTDESPLGYVESPAADRLAAEGILFTRAFTQAPACGPSRGALLSGRYPFRTSHFSFDLTHQNPDFVRPSLPEHMRDAGYATSTFGKHDPYIYRWGPGQGFYKPDMFDLTVHFKHDLQNHGIGDLFTRAQYGTEPGASAILGYTETVVYPDGEPRSYFLKRHEAELTDEDRAGMAQTNAEFEILRSYTRDNPNLILGGENPRPAGDTIDAYIVEEFSRYLNNPNGVYSTMNGREEQGANTQTPQFIHLGFHYPHTPVLPPKSFRDRFKTKSYDVPEFDEAELEKLPEQLRRLYDAMTIQGFSEAEKQQAIQDYYAFTAYGDALIGQAVDEFVAYSEANDQDYVIIYTIGDHGWHLGEQGIEAKFGPWRQSVENAAIIMASDKSLIPAGLVDETMVEFVDFAPTILELGGVDTSGADYAYLDGVSLLDVMDGSAGQRDYILGEMNLVSGPRAYLHTDRFRFSMRTRPYYGAVPYEDIGKDIRWALEAPRSDVDMALYDLEIDPLERNNVADAEDYAPLADWLRDKLGRIVLGDGRVEANWSQANTFVVSDFADGADDKQLNIPAGLVPVVGE